MLPAVPERLKTMAMDAVRWQHQAGFVSDAEWLTYAHAWQTGAARLAIRACHCEECCQRFPESEGYAPV